MQSFNARSVTEICGLDLMVEALRIKYRAAVMEAKSFIELRYTEEFGGEGI